MIMGWNNENIDTKLEIMTEKLVIQIVRIYKARSTQNY
jgi:hypothetical protein